MKAKLHLSTIGALASALLLLQPSHLLGAPPSLSEMLEKGIYTEETKGDIEGAMAIYRELLAEAKANEAFAAQAQLRIAQCLLKRNRVVEATAEFEKIIRDYPNQKDIIAKAREHLPRAIAMNPIPWVDGERLKLLLKTATGMDIGVTEYRATKTEVDGREVWRVGARLFAGIHSVSHVDVDPETFRPIASRWKHQMLGEAKTIFGDGQTELHVSGKSPVVAKSEALSYDNEQYVHLMRRLPLAVGYKAEAPVFTSLGGGAVVPIGLEVTGTETVNTPLGDFECYKVVLSVGQTFWISTDANRYLAKFDAAGLTATLIAISQRKLGEPVPFRDDAAGISFTAPGEWVLHQRQSGGKPGEQVIFMLDPDGDANADMRVFPTQNLSAVARSAPRAWAEEVVKNHIGKDRQEFAIRTDSWKTLNVSGRPAVSLIADYTQQGKSKVFYGVFALGPQQSEAFEIDCERDKFEGLKPAFDSIIASYRSK